MIMTDNNSPSPAANTVEEITEVIKEFEQYRERLLNDTVTAAKKARLQKKTAMAKIEPELKFIDTSLENLRSQLASLQAEN